MATINLDPDQMDELVLQHIRSSIETSQFVVEHFADITDVTEDCQAIYHLMHAYNYYSPPDEHYDVP